MTRATGKIVRFDEVRGYGFITPDMGGDDVFLHANDLEMEKRQATRGARVSFGVEEGDRGKFATEVRLSTDTQPARTSNTLATDAGSPNDEYFDVFSTEEFAHVVTERLLKITPPLTSQQILAIRSNFEELARKHGLVDS
ncbi:cold-shock protein [Mycobacterium spongiae]|uniref:cold-shock protein n=1 Tax=Mycobacterium spongiae TaxID=886343 RepID=UPI001FE54C9D|nr:cold shock domain-containing protein [Mycobacterium spongiae]